MPEDDAVSQPLTVSVALATYNGDVHLMQQLQSLANQSRLPSEVVVTDDGSTDRTYDIVHAFSLVAPFPVRLYSNKNKLGFADNFLYAASLCKSDLIAFCDQDDFWQPNKLELCVPTFHDPIVMLCTHSAEVWDGQSTSGEMYPHFTRTETCATGEINPFYLMPGFAMVIRSTLVHLVANECRPRDVRVPRPMAHDQWVWLLASLCGSIAIIADSLVLYRQHASNTVGVPAKGRIYSLMLAFRHFQYEALAQTERDCSELALALSNAGLSAPLQENAVLSARLMSERSHMHSRRAVLYDETSGFLERLAAFREIYRLHGYRADPAGYRLGNTAAVKDIVIGVLGLYRLFL